jgi:hypothetical protein
MGSRRPTVQSPDSGKVADTVLTLQGRRLFGEETEKVELLATLVVSPRCLVFFG